jgi:PAS domain S-box-containing protein
MIQENNNSTKSGKKGASSANEGILRKYIDLFNRLPIGIYRTTPEGKILTANPVFLAMLGYSNVYDLEGIDLSKSHKNPEARKAFVREMDEKGEVYAKESILVDSNGKEITVEEYAKVYKNDAGQVLFYEGIVIDITQKVRDYGRIKFLDSFKELILNLSTSFVNIRLNDIDDQIVYSLKSIGEFIGADRSYVILFDDDEMKYMSNTHEWVADGISSVIDELQEIETAKHPWWMDNLLKNKAIVIPEVEDLPPEAESERLVFTRQNIQSLFAVPMFFDYRLIGFLGFDMVRTHKVVDEDSFGLLQIAASLFASILNYQKTEMAIAENRNQLEQLVVQRTQELNESNERFKALVENTSDWIWEVDANGIYTYSSPMSNTMIGYEPVELLGRAFSHFLDPETRQDTVAVFQNNAASKAAFKNLENAFLHKMGKKILFETSGIPIFDHDGFFTGFRGISRDVTEKKNIESTLRQSQMKLSQHLRNTPLGYIEWDTNLEVIEWNPAAQAIFGYNKTEAMLENMVKKLVPKDQRNEVMEVFPMVFEGGKSVRKTNYCITRDGRKILCEWYNTPLYDESDNIIGLASLVREIRNKE